MEKNYLLELGGNVDLIATAVCDFDTPLKHYKKGQIVLDFKDIQCLLETRIAQSSARSIKTDLNYNTLQIAALRCNYVPLERQIYDLLSTDKQKTRIVESEEVQCGMDGLIILNSYVPLTDTIKVDGIDMTTVRFDSNEEYKTTILYSEEFRSAEHPIYKVQYEKEEALYRINLDSHDVDIPYLHVQLKVRGNADKETSTYYVKIDKSRLVYNPILQFGNDNVTYCNLSFMVIDSGEVPYLVG